MDCAGVVSQVDSWTVPVFCGFGVVRLIRVALDHNLTEMFMLPLFKVAIEFM